VGLLLVGSLVPASITCSFWDNYGALVALPIGFAATAAVYMRQRGPARPVDVVFGLAVGVAAAVVAFLAILACSLAFANCG
jgi:hypothetical protein